MRSVAWILAVAALFGGLWLHTTPPFAMAESIAVMLYAMSALLCPLFWSGEGAPLALLGINGRQRALLCLAMVFALPLVLF